MSDRNRKYLNASSSLERKLQNRARSRIKEKKAEGSRPSEDRDVILDGLKQWMVTYLYVTPEEGGDAIPWVDWWEAQVEIVDEAIDHLKRGEQYKLCDLKSRRVGVSFAVAALMFAVAWHFPGMNGFIAAHLETTSAEILKYIRGFWDNMPQDMKDQRPLRGGEVRQDGFAFDKPHYSQAIIGSGKSKDVFHGHTVQAAHVSEGGLQEDLQRLLTGGLPAAKSAWMIIVEGTASGKNAFYQLCEMARAGRGGWKFKFQTWINEKRSRIPVKKGEKFTLDEAEQKYWDDLKAVGIELRMPQMKWARKTRESECLESWEIFHSQYPATPELAFLYSGTPLFDSTKVQADLALCPEVPPFRGDIEWSSEELPETKLVSSPFGPLVILRHPESGHQYCESGDAGEGLRQDYSELMILDKDDGFICAHYRSNTITPGDMATKAYQLGSHYHMAIIGIEAMWPGNVPLNLLARGSEDFPKMAGAYPRLYYEIRTDEVTLEETQRFGFRAGKGSKNTRLTRVMQAYNRGNLIVRSRELLLQMDGALWNFEKKKLLMQYTDPRSNLKNDDGIITLSLANELRTHVRLNQHCPEAEAPTWG